MLLRKPTWMNLETWRAMLARCDGVPRCVVTGETDDLSVDHIVPTFQGGTDDLSNLQWMAKRLNFGKGARPDSYWSQPFYFDQRPNFLNCRTAQKGIYDTIWGTDYWFSEPISTISRLLYVFPIVVGGGKTLATLMAASAYNAIIKARWGAARRCDKLLILTKERAIRAQLADDIAKKAVKFGIFPTPPRVQVMSHGYMWKQEGLRRENDVFVSCIQALWDSGRELPSLLHDYPVIFIDEPHFAIDRVIDIVENAKTSVCFGGTGTPIDSAGKLLPRMIKTYSFGYRDASVHDRSVKYLNAVDWRQHVKIVQINESTLLSQGEVQNANDTNLPDYEKNFVPAKSVCEAVIVHMEECDQLAAQTVHTKAPHRAEYECEVSVFYPVHAMISCEYVRFADHLAQTINRFFDQHRDRFPREQGWHAEVVHAEGEEPDGSKRKDKPLDPDHSWMRAKNRPGYKCDRHCSRILLVVGMGREGVDNPLCGVSAITHDKFSEIEVVQRLIGRQIRAVTEITEDGRFCVPPAELDSVKIITHVVFNEGVDTIQQGIDFVVNMDDRLAGMTTIDQLCEGEDPAARPPGRDLQSLPFPDKIAIAGAIGADPATDDDDLIHVFGHGNFDTEAKVADFVQLVREQPLEAGSRLRFDRDLTSIPIVLREVLARDPTDEQITRFVKVKYPQLVELAICDQNRPVFRQLYLDNAAAVDAATPKLLNADGSERTLTDVRRNIAWFIERSLGHHYVKTETNKKLLHAFVGSAVKRKLGVRDGERAGDDSQYNIPNCHLILERGEVMSEIRAWVIARLIREGALPSLAALHQANRQEAAE